MSDWNLISTTLTGNSEATIGEALRSVVDWVDACIVVDTGVTDGTLSVAREVVGEKLIVESYSWCNDFSKARNFCLDAAYKHKADWALTLDTDERILLHGEDLRSLLRSTPHGALMMPDQKRTYTKERAFRIPMLTRYQGPTHESFAAHEVGMVIAKQACFFELPKSPEQYKRKFERDVEILQSHVQRNPEDPRWHFYLGNSLKDLGQYREAIASYRSCHALRGWNEESAWACFRAAQCHEELGEYREMLDILVLGMATHAGIAELMWYSGYAASRLNDHQQAVYWARLAIVFGLYQGTGADVKRIGFKHLPGLFEGPFDVLRFSLRSLGELESAEKARETYEDAKKARLRYEKGEP